MEETLEMWGRDESCYLFLALTLLVTIRGVTVGSEKEEKKFHFVPNWHQQIVNWFLI
jgi:hypothetical protein